MSVTRTALCSVKGCPAPKDPDWHVPHCGHGLAGEHQHYPKRSQGGKEVVAFLCNDCHMETDNGLWHDGIIELDGVRRYYIKDIQGNDVLDIIINASTAGLISSPATAEAHNQLTPESMLRGAGQLSGGEYETAVTFPPQVSTVIGPGGPLAGNPRPFLDMDYEEWRSWGPRLAHNLNASRWLLGEWLLDGEQKWGQMYTQAEAETGLDYSTLTSYRSVVKAYREAELLPQATTSFSVLSVLAPLVRRDAEVGEKLLLEAEAQSWTGDDAKREVKALSGAIEHETRLCDMGYSHKVMT